MRCIWQWCRYLLLSWRRICLWMVSTKSTFCARHTLQGAGNGKCPCRCLRSFSTQAFRAGMRCTVKLKKKKHHAYSSQNFRGEWRRRWCHHWLRIIQYASLFKACRFLKEVREKSQNCCAPTRKIQSAMTEARIIICCWLQLKMLGLVVFCVRLAI